MEARERWAWASRKKDHGSVSFQLSNFQVGSSFLELSNASTVLCKLSHELHGAFQFQRFVLLWNVKSSKAPSSLEEQQWGQKLPKDSNPSQNELKMPKSFKDSEMYRKFSKTYEGPKSIQTSNKDFTFDWNSEKWLKSSLEGFVLKVAEVLKKFRRTICSQMLWKLSVSLLN